MIKYNIELKDWDINDIIEIEYIYDKRLKNIQL